MATKPNHYTLEHHFKLYNNSSGEFTSIGDDSEGSSACEIKQGNNTIFIPKEVIPLFISALQKWKDSQYTECEDE